jgi:hypothetical protein
MIWIWNWVLIRTRSISGTGSILATRSIFKPDLYSDPDPYRELEPCPEMYLYKSRAGSGTLSKSGTGSGPKHSNKTKKIWIRPDTVPETTDEHAMVNPLFSKAFWLKVNG